MTNSDSGRSATAPSSVLERLRDYWILTKPEVNVLVLTTTLTAFYLASRPHVQLWLLFHTLAGTLLVASGTATLNQFMEREHDARMHRTSRRPLPAGRLRPAEVLVYGLALSLAGGAYLLVAVNALCSLLAVLTLASYLLVYTPLKRRSAVCTLIGAIPGAMPPLIGWAGARGSLAPEAWVLFAIVFLWQFPHFLAIALMYREDYARAGFRMLPAADHDGKFTGLEIVILTALLVPVSLVPAWLHQAGAVYLLAACAAGVFFLHDGVRLAISRSRPAARRLVHSSVIYLPVIFAVLMWDKGKG